LAKKTTKKEEVSEYVRVISINRAILETEAIKDSIKRELDGLDTLYVPKDGMSEEDAKEIATSTAAKVQRIVTQIKVCEIMELTVQSALSEVDVTLTNGTTYKASSMSTVVNENSEYTARLANTLLELRKDALNDYTEDELISPFDVVSTAYSLLAHSEDLRLEANDEFMKVLATKTVTIDLTPVYGPTSEVSE
jgi:transcriptional antiterminator Rof (Rho-off)